MLNQLKIIVKMSKHEQEPETNTLLFPPEPPSINKPGEFLYVKDIHTRKMLSSCWEAVTITDTWDFLKYEIGKNGFINDSGPEVHLIYNKIEELPNSIGHSGYSFIWTLKQMQTIAIKGEEEYKKLYIK